MFLKLAIPVLLSFVLNSFCSKKYSAMFALKGFEPTNCSFGVKLICQQCLTSTAPFWFIIELKKCFPKNAYVDQPPWFGLIRLALLISVLYSNICQNYVDDEGTKDNKQMIVYCVISGHFTLQNRLGSELPETDGIIQMVNTCKYTN